MVEKNILETVKHYQESELGALFGKDCDSVNNPKHYNSHPSGIECIVVTEHMGFNLGNAIKYIWRADLKLNALEDLKKAAWYLNREIEKREKNIG